MTAPTLEVLAPLRTAILANSAIVAKLGTFQGAAAVHTRRPVPVDTGWPLVTIGPIITRTDEDLINGYRPIIVIDVNCYGEAIRDYRTVEAVADMIYAMFHRQRAITVTGYSVVQITASGPSPAPADDDQHVGRRVTLTIRLDAN